MYYVIKRQIGIPLVTFIGFKVPKYIASKNSENIIFEFTKDGKAVVKATPSGDDDIYSQSFIHII